MQDFSVYMKHKHENSFFEVSQSSLQNFISISLYLGVA